MSSSSEYEQASSSGSERACEVPPIGAVYPEIPYNPAAQASLAADLQRMGLGKLLELPWNIVMPSLIEDFLALEPPTSIKSIRPRSARWTEALIARVYNLGRACVIPMETLERLLRISSPLVAGPGKVDRKLSTVSTRPT